MEEQSLKNHVRTQVRDFIFKMLRHFKRKRTGLIQCTELRSHTSEACGFGPRTVQRSHSEENWEWNKTMVINNNTRAVEMFGRYYCELLGSPAGEYEDGWLLSFCAV